MAKIPDDDDELMRMLGRAVRGRPAPMKGPSSGGQPGTGYGKKKGCAVTLISAAGTLLSAALRARGML